MEQFKNSSLAFYYTYTRTLKAGETVIVKMPPVAPNKRGINDIGWQADGDVTLYGTLCVHPEEPDTLWQEIFPGEDINKTVWALKVKNNNMKEPTRILIRAIFC